MGKNYHFIIYTFFFCIGLFLSGTSALAQVENALNFDGSNDNVSLPASINTQITGNNITIEGWFNLEDLSNNTMLIGEDSLSDSDIKFFIGDFNSTQFQAGFYDGSFRVLTHTKPNLNTWVHIAASYDGSIIRLYYNGVEVANAVQTNALPGSTGVWRLGISMDNTNFFRGTMDEVRIWNVARSASEIANNYKSDINPATSGLVAYYKFNQGISRGNNLGLDTLIDSSGSSDMGSLVSFSLFGNTSNWVGSAAPNVRYPVGVNGSSLWLDAGSELTGSPTVTAWEDKMRKLVTIVNDDPQFSLNDKNFNPAVSFDGTGDYFRIPVNSNLNTLNYTISTVVKPASGGSGYRAVVSSKNNANFRGYVLHINPSNEWEFWVPGSGTWTVLNGGTVAFDEYALITATFNTFDAFLYINGTQVVTSAGAFAPPNSAYEFRLGAGHTTGGAVDFPFLGEIPEFVYYPSILSASNRQKLESYLAVKYGLTQDPAVTNYINSSTSSIWDATDAFYHNDVIGIGRDDISQLLQKQSTTQDDSTQIYLSTLAADNTANTGTFSTDDQFVMIGHNNALLDTSAGTEYPAGQGIFRRFDREWKVVNTNFDGTFSMDIQMSTVSPSVATDLILLVDDDGDFNNATVGTATFAINSGKVTISGISTADIPTNSTRYVTFASDSARLSLPVRLISFEARMDGEKSVHLAWSTATEINSSHFDIESSTNLKSWKNIGRLESSGNSEVEKNYNFIDQNPQNGINYYRLKQVDIDGQFEYSKIRSIYFTEDESIKLYPIPATKEIVVTGAESSDFIRISDLTGKAMNDKVVVSDKELDGIIIEIEQLQNGFYILEVNSKKLKFIKEE